MATSKWNRNLALLTSNYNRDWSNRANLLRMLSPRRTQKRWKRAYLNWNLRVANQNFRNQLHKKMLESWINSNNRHLRDDWVYVYFGENPSLPRLSEISDYCLRYALSYNYKLKYLTAILNLFHLICVWIYVNQVIFFLTRRILFSLLLLKNCLGERFTNTTRYLF